MSTDNLMPEHKATPHNSMLALIDQHSTNNVNSTTQMDNSSSIISSSNSTTAISNSASVVRFVKDNIWLFMTVIQHRYPVKGKKLYLLFLLLHIYYMYITMVSPTLSTQIQVPSSTAISSAVTSLTNVHGSYGKYGMWIFKAMNYPITLSLDWIPYEAAIAITACSMVISIVHLIILLIIFKTKFGRFQEKLKNISFSIAICILFLGPPSTFVMASFIDCNYQQLVYSELDKMYSPSLFRFPEIICTSGINNSMILISVIGIVFLSIAWFASMFILPMSNPKSSLPFLIAHKLPICFIYASTGLRIFIHFAIPSQYEYARAAFHIVFALWFVVMIAFQIPLFKRIENSVIFAVMCTYFAFGVGVLVSSIVSLYQGNADMLGVIMAAGLTIGLACLTFVLSFSGFEIYTRIVYKSIQQKIQRKKDNEPSEIGDFYQSSIYLICEESSLRNLKLYLQFVAHSNDSHEISQALTLVKSESPQKFFTSPSILMTASDLVANCWGDENRLNFCLFLLKKALKHNSGPWLAVQIKFMLRDIESELFENANYGKFGYDVKNLLLEIEKKQDQIKSIHKLFWKEMLSDIPNNEKLERINATAAHLTHYCEEQFRHLLKSFSHDKTVLRYYANFLETIKQDKELAASYYEEATTLEEEDNKVKPSLKRFRNKVVPDLPESSSWNLFKPSNNRKEFNNEDLEKESFGGIEKQVEKQNIYRASLNTPIKSRMRIFGFLAIIVGGYFLGVAEFFLSMIYGDILKKTELVRRTSLPCLSPGSLIRDIRMRQMVFELFNNENRTWPMNGTREYSALNYFLTNYKDRIRNQRDVLLELSSLSRSGQFTQIMYNDFTREENPILIPISSGLAFGKELEYISGFSKNTSMSDLNQEMIQHATFFNLATDDEFNKTTTSYPFMYLYQNRGKAADAALSFFRNFQRNHKEVIQDLDRMLWNYFLLAPLSLIIIITASLIASRIEMHRLSLILSLYKKFPKDMIGVVYHEIGKKGEDVMYEKSNILLRPKEFSIIASIFVVLVIVSYSGLVYSDVYVNVTIGKTNLLIVDHIVVLMRASHIITSRLGEIYAYQGFNPGLVVNSMIDPSQLQVYRQESRACVSLIASSYNGIVYGDNATQPLIGRYAKIDNIINGPTNCTADTPVQECSNLHAFISAFTISSSKLIEDFFNPNFQKTDSLFYQVLSIYNTNDILNDKLISLMDLLFTSTSESNKALSVVLFIAGTMCYYFFGFLVLNSFVVYDRQITNLRSFLNYIPVEFIDSSESLRNFIYFNSITYFKKNNKSNNDDSLRNVLGSMVDGALLVNEKSEIMLFNLTAQKMFGKSPEEVIGLTFFNLFDQSEKLTAIIKQVKMSLTDPNGKHGETLELDCIRKNQSKFPAIVNIFATREKGAVIYAFFIKDITSEKKQNALLNEEKKNSENLLRNILPDSVAARLKAGTESLIADKFADITCFFSDMVGFTKLSSGMAPNELVIMLNTVVNAFDNLTDKYHLEKIKTIGDAYFCVGGLHGLNAQSDHPERCVRFSIDTLQVIKDYNTENPHAQINIRIGLNSGSVVAGVIGRKKFAYDLWGDTINIASRMESTSLSGRIQLSRSTYERVYDLFSFDERKIEVKGKGSTLAYLLKEKHHCNPIITIESKGDEEPEENDIEVEKKAY